MNGSGKSGLDLTKQVIVEKDDIRYPDLLRIIPNPPERLYCFGDVSLLKSKCMAVVGSRHATSYGKEISERLARRLATRGVTTVSGLAAGIDSFAHRGALNGKGKTIAVLGNSLDYCFPKYNLDLMREIAEKGLIVSEYPEGTHSTKFTFPMRNRIISGLSLATIVVEAAINSGSLITADIANEQGRTVYAVPGNINSIYSLGTNKLIRDGANAISVIDDILDDFNIIGSENEQLCMLSADELSYVKLLKEKGEMSLSDISIELNLSVGNVASLTTFLEMKGIIHMDYGKIFLAN